ncbi:MAG: hypothetical protein NZ958_04180 [Bacteroidia bacterium]|nr:hypothetical protein [Bacteroidia bacterium]MDW8088416.1 hypothetical protein [Bacteroidia bacterium]
MRSAVILLVQIYAIPPPVAYCPAPLLGTAYKVVADLSGPWADGRVPFQAARPWKRCHCLQVPPSTLLYVQGAVGELAVSQNNRILALEKRSAFLLPLLPMSKAKLCLIGLTGGGITGSLYVMRPPEPTDSVVRSMALLPLSPISKSSDLVSPSLTASAFPFLYPGLLMLATALLVGAIQLFPLLRSVLWQGFLLPLSLSSIEIWIGLAFVGLFGGLLALKIGPLALGVFGVIGAEALILALHGANPNWSWQKWLAPLFLAALLGIGKPIWGQIALYAAWSGRSLLLVRQFPSFAYLCTAEAFLYYLI